MPAINGVAEDEPVSARVPPSGAVEGAGVPLPPVFEPGASTSKVASVVLPRVQFFVVST